MVHSVFYKKKKQKTVYMYRIDALYRCILGHPVSKLPCRSAYFKDFGGGRGNARVMHRIRDTLSAGDVKHAWDKPGVTYARPISTVGSNLASSVRRGYLSGIACGR
jgi:hypothetical protein